MNSQPQSSTSDRYITPGQGDAWAAEAAATGQRGTQRVTAAEEVTAPPEVAAALDLNPDATVVLRRRVMLLDGRPVELTDSYYPSSIAAGTPLAELGKIPGGAITLLADLGYTPNHAWDDITARTPTPKEQHELDITERDPVIVLTRLTFAADGTPFEYSVMTMTAAGRHLRYQTKA
ncbi:GntR family transcriptional regulator [Micromonospora echinospora]|uniref:GntR family transcriptional regulator n=1 Tax=Micromonospora echinospora TaxID=1877 RepID=UPI003787D204